MDAAAVAPVCAHVLDIELSQPITGLEQTASDGRCADRAWALVRLFGEPIGLDVLKIPSAGLSRTDVFELELERWMPRLSQILGIEGPEPSRRGGWQDDPSLARHRF